MDEVEQIIARIPGWSQARDLKIERIGGLTNQNFRVTVGDERYVLRVSGENTARLGINRSQELIALENAAKAGIGPEVLQSIQPEGHLVTRWIEGRHWEVAEYRTPENVRLLTEMVKRIHALPPSGAIFSPFRRVYAYLETARSFGVPLPNDFDDALAAMRRVEQEQQQDPSDWQRFCHNDLVAVNYLFIEPERSIKVLDWEFSGCGDIYYDLATVVYTHDSFGPIPSELEEVMLECYFGQVSDQHRSRLLGMKYMLMLFTGMWGLAQHGMQLGGLIPPVEGFDYLEFAQYLFEHDIPELRSQV